MITGIDAPAGPAELVNRMQAGGWAQLEIVPRMGAVARAAGRADAAAGD